MKKAGTKVDETMTFPRTIYAALNQLGDQPPMFREIEKKASDVDGAVNTGEPLGIYILVGFAEVNERRTTEVRKRNLGNVNFGKWELEK